MVWIFGELKLKMLSVELPKFPLLYCAARILNLPAAKGSRLHTIKLKYMKLCDFLKILICWGTLLHGSICIILVTSLAGQWLRLHVPITRGPDSIPVGQLISHMLGIKKKKIHIVFSSQKMLYIPLERLKQRKRERGEMNIYSYITDTRHS